MSKRLCLTAMIAALTVVGWRALNPVSHFPPLTDSGVFASGAQHLLAGKVLYRDVWDNKQPVVFGLNALALSLGDGSIDSVRVMERFFSAARALLFFFIVLHAFGRRGLALGAALIFIIVFSAPSIFERGNLTEEYAATFVLGAILSVQHARKTPRLRLGLALAALAGLLFSTAVFTKETFLLSSVPWFVYLLTGRKWSWRRNARLSGAFIAGALVPLILCLSYFISHGALGHWGALIAFNFDYAARESSSLSTLGKLWANTAPAYEKVFATSITTHVAFWVGLGALCALPFLRSSGFFPVAAVAAFAFDYIGTMISERRLGHYYMQLAPSFALVGASGAALLLYLCDKAGKAKPFLVAMAVAAVALADRAPIRDFAGGLLKPARRATISDMSRFIRVNSEPDELLWVSSIHASRFYLETGRLSPTPRFAPHPAHFQGADGSVRPERLTAMLEDLRTSPPKFIVVRENSVGDSGRIKKWIRANYARVAQTGDSDQLHIRTIEPYAHIWRRTKNDYEEHYASAHFRSGRWTPSGEIDEQRRRYRRLLFYRNEAAARSVEAIEAIRYENDTRTNFRRKRPGGGPDIIGGDFGEKDGDCLEYSFYLDRNLEEGELRVVYLTKRKNVTCGIAIDGEPLDDLALPPMDGLDPGKFGEATLQTPPLQPGLHRLRVSGRGQPVKLDMFYFEVH